MIDEDLIQSHDEKHEDCLIERFDRESWWETWRLFDKKLWREVMIESHEEKTWRSFDRKLWRKVMIESHC